MMSTRAVIAISLLTLSACSDRARDEESRYDIVANGNDNVATCGQAKKVAAAYLDQKDQPQYETWKLRSEIACSSAEMEPYNTQGFEPDDMSTMTDNMAAQDLRQTPDNAP